MAGVKGQVARKQKHESKKFPEYYKLHNPEWTDEQCKEAAKKFKKSTNWQCVEYYQAIYPELTLAECEAKRKEAIYNARKNNPIKIEYYIERYPDLTDEERKKMCKEYIRTTNYQCIEYYERNYPELSHEEHERMLNEKINNAATKIIAKISGEGNGMHKSKTTDEERRRISPRCIEFYEYKYPELSHREHEQLLQAYFDKNRECIKNAVKTTNLEYYLNQGMSEDEAKHALKERQTTFTLEKCIAKYGEEEGTRRYKKRQLDWSHSLHNSFSHNSNDGIAQSKFANSLIESLCKNLCLNFDDCIEHRLYDNVLNKMFIYDFVYKNKFIEINGDYWHCNPSKYDADFYNKSKNMTAKQIWEKDQNKIDAAKRAGYDIYVVWEKDYRDNPKETIKRCTQFLLS